VRVWDLEKGTEIRKLQHVGNLIRVALSRTASGRDLDPEQRRYRLDVDASKELFKLEHPGQVWQIRISPDAAAVYTAAAAVMGRRRGNNPATKENSEIRVWDCNPQGTASVEGPLQLVWAMAVSATAAIW